MINLGKLKLVVLMIVCASPFTWAATFSYTDSLMNVPVAHMYRADELQFGFSGGYAGSGSKVGVRSQYEFDYKLNYSVDNRLQLSFNMINSSALVGHVQYNLFKKAEAQRIAIGIRNLSSKSLSTWDTYTPAPQMSSSPYIVTSMAISKDMNAHLGYGLRTFQNSTKTLPGLGETLQSINGLFFGVDYTFEGMKVMGEFDGKDFNTGLKLFLTPNIELDMALTEMFLSDSDNANYAGAPRRSFSFGLTFRNIFDRDPKMNNRMRQINERIEHLEGLQNEMSSQLPATSESSFSPETNYITDSKPQEEKISIRATSTDHQVARLYTQSFDFYLNKDYANAISVLNQALAIDPSNSVIYTRLGSIYYDLDMVEQALMNWNKAIKLDPTNAELRSIRDEVLNYYKH